MKLGNFGCGEGDRRPTGAQQGERMSERQTRGEDSGVVQRVVHGLRWIMQAVLADADLCRAYATGSEKKGSVSE